MLVACIGMKGDRAISLASNFLLHIGKAVSFVQLVVYANLLFLLDLWGIGAMENEKYYSSEFTVVFLNINLVFHHIQWLRGSKMPHPANSAPLIPIKLQVSSYVKEPRKESD